MYIEQLDKSKIPIKVLGSNLEQFRKKALFTGKVKRANEILEKTGLPKNVVQK